MTKGAVYKHDLGGGLFLSAYSLTPEIDERRLAESIGYLDGKAAHDLAALAKIVIQTDHLDSMADLELVVHPGEYHVPAPLQPYREAIGKKWESEGKFNGPVLMATQEIKFPLHVIQGGYFDFAATRLNEEPAKLVPGVYQQGKTVEDVLVANGFTADDRAKYFGFAHLMWPSNGDEFLLVQRAKGMGIAGDRVASPGSTPDIVPSKPGVKKPGFGVKEYWSYHFAEEMKDEFHLGWGDFWPGDIRVFDDKREPPFGAATIHTELSTGEIAERAYGDARVLKEHSILYSMPPAAMRTFLTRFPIHPSIARVMDLISS